VNYIALVADMIATVMVLFDIVATECGVC
jgi:hypothetical protein